MKKDLVSIKNLNIEEIEHLMDLTGKVKAKELQFPGVMENKTLGLVFQKPSARTRISFEAGVYQLGGNVVYLSPQDLRLGERESIKDIARVLSRYLDIVVARTFTHEHIIELAQHSTIPIINGLSDLLHPCQVLSDLYTMQEKKKSLSGSTLAFIGDGNNVAHSLLYGCAKAGINLKVATPKGYRPKSDIVQEAEALAKESGAKIELSNEPQAVVSNADIVYTDVWASMGQEKEREKRLKDFKKFQLNAELLSKAKPAALVMHCLPAHRGEEITDEVIDGKQSIVFDQAENRLHMQKSILLYLLGLDK